MVDDYALPMQSLPFAIYGSTSCALMRFTSNGRLSAGSDSRGGKGVCVIILFQGVSLEGK